MCIAYSERQIIQSLELDEDKILKTLEILKFKNGGFEAITNHLMDKKMFSLAEQLDPSLAANKLEKMATKNSWMSRDHQGVVAKFSAIVASF